MRMHTKEKTRLHRSLRDRPRAIAAALVCLVCTAPPANAVDLEDLVASLYGGDGIQLLDVPPPPPPFTHRPHFELSSVEGLDTLGTEVVASLGLFSLNSTVSGFTFDLERGVPVQTDDSLGPSLAERATTLGARKLNMAFSYTRLEFKWFEGDRRKDLSFTLDHEDVGPPGPPLFFEGDKIRVDLDLQIDEDVFAFYTNYGLTPRLDVGLVLPIVHIRMRAKGVASIIDNGGGAVHEFDPITQDPRVSTAREDTTGIGDVTLRAKYNLMRDQPDWPDLAARALVQLPTGQEEDLLGTGETQLALLLIASKSFERFTPYANLGYSWAPGESELNHLRYITGVDVKLNSKLTTALTLLGRWEPTGDGIGDSLIDLALGVKWNAFGSVILGANILRPINIKDGLRPALAWTLGVEGTF